MPAIAHIHTYVKYKNRPGFYRCEAPDCTHIIDKELLLGKLSLCSLCGSQMILTREDLRRAKPRCLNCSETKKAKLHKKANEITKLLGTAAFDPLQLRDKQGGLDFASNPLSPQDEEPPEPPEEEDFSDFSNFFKDPKEHGKKDE